jgi:hypothetical protein
VTSSQSDDGVRARPQAGVPERWLVTLTLPRMWLNSRPPNWVTLSITSTRISLSECDTQTILNGRSGSGLWRMTFAESVGGLVSSARIVFDSSRSGKPPSTASSRIS